MALYQYEVLVADGEKKAGRITARDNDDARKKIAQRYQVIDFVSLDPQRVITAPPKATKAKSQTKLQRLLYLQHNLCFFCGKPLQETEASVEHLNPQSRGGTKTEDNEVACHATLNAVFGSMDLRRKFQFVIDSKGNFKCPQL